MEWGFAKMACYWFANVNHDDKSIKLCRYGSFCKYLHFTKEELEMCVSHGKDVVDCEKCAWKSKPSPSGLPWFEEVQESARRQMPCFYCKDTKKTTMMSRVKRQAQDRDWCRCTEDTHTEVYDDHPRHPGKLVTVCETCRCIVTYAD